MNIHDTFDIHFIIIVSSRMERGAKSGQPHAIFIGDWGGGHWNKELLGLEWQSLDNLETSLFQVQKRKGHPALQRPTQDSIKFTLHET